jgi:hypothetical protein
MANNGKKMMQLVAAVERDDPEEQGKKKSFWTRIGVAFANRDGSWNLLFDYYPARPEITVQLREFAPKDESSKATG